MTLPLFLLISCGGNGGAGGGIRTGAFIDAAVINIGYRTASQEGVTNDQGEYNYLPGETVTFFIGNLELPPVIASGIVTPLDIAGTTDISDPTIVNISRLLQTLDKDGNPDNGIEITEEAKTIAAAVHFGVSTADFETNTDIINLISNGGQDTPFNTLILESDAIAHLYDQVRDLYPVTIAAETSNILVDGDLSDWGYLLSVINDPIGDYPSEVTDQYGFTTTFNSSVDLHQYGIAFNRINSKIYFMFKTVGDFDFLLSNSYDVRLKVFPNLTCSTSKIPGTNEEYLHELAPQNLGVDKGPVGDPPSDQVFDKMLNNWGYRPNQFFGFGVDPRLAPSFENSVNTGGISYESGVGTNTYEIAFSGVLSLPSNNTISPVPVRSVEMLVTTAYHNTGTEGGGDFADDSYWECFSIPW